MWSSLHCHDGNLHSLNLHKLVWVSILEISQNWKDLLRFNFMLYCYICYNFHKPEQRKNLAVCLLPLLFTGRRKGKGGRISYRESSGAFMDFQTVSFHTNLLRMTCSFTHKWQIGEVSCTYWLGSWWCLTTQIPWSFTCKWCSHWLGSLTLVILWLFLTKKIFFK